jgi:glycerol-3-phosphate dehydrogenase (NAD(P)+)
MQTPIARATIIGDGAMGTLCALLLAEHGTEVVLWGAFPQHIAAMRSDRENRQFLPGYRLPESIALVDEVAAACEDPTVIVSAVPCQYIRRVWERFERHAPRTVPIVNVAKGIEIGTLLRPTDIVKECLGEVPSVCLSGPSIAPEVAAKMPASVVAASEDAELATLVQTGLATNYFRIYTSRDLLGVELAGAVKNIIALAAGIADGINAGVNAKAALLTRGLVEITRLGVAMGASADTFRGLAGVGDLFTTCVSSVSRNRTAGERIGRGETADNVISTTTSVIEGIPTTKGVLELAARHHVELPIVSAVASVLFEGIRPAEAIEKLMTRPLRDEQSW